MKRLCLNLYFFMCDNASFQYDWYWFATAGVFETCSSHKHSHQAAEKQRGNTAVEEPDKENQACFYPSVNTWWTGVDSIEGRR